MNFFNMSNTQLIHTFYIMSKNDLCSRHFQFLTAVAPNMSKMTFFSLAVNY